MRLLSTLERLPAGATVRDHVGEVLEAYEGELSSARDAGVALARAILTAWRSRIADHDAEAAELDLLTLRLEHAPGPEEFALLLKRIQDLAAPSRAGAQAMPPAPVARVAEGAARRPQAEPPEASPAPAERPAAPAPEPGPTIVDGEERIDGTYRRNLAEKRERIQRIQERLLQEVNDVIKQNEKFGVLLEVEHESLRRADSIEELEGLKGALIGEVDKLRSGHQALSRKLESAISYLQIMGTEGRHLNEELTRAHILSLTDELTDLPNRRAFLRRLEDEVARVQRYGYPLSLALIDMDSFKAVNDKYGHGAGDEVLRTFATSVLSIFRHHDMVARYGGEEFAVLLPNTDRHGAQRALEKVRRRTSEIYYQFEGRTMPMPTFSAGISLYRPGETASALIERADKALYQAKRLGRNRVELAQHDTAEASAR